MRTPSENLEVWFLTGSQELYGEATLRQVAEQSRQIVALLNGGPEISVPIVWKPVLVDAAHIRRACLDANSADQCIGVMAWMHTFSPAKAWVAGLDVLAKPLLHLHTQANLSLPWAEIDMDFMNLNQAAHGDREFGYIQTRLACGRKTVAGHCQRPGVRARVGAWARAATAGMPAQGPAPGPLRRQHARRRRDRGRQGRGPVAPRRVVNTYSVNELVAAVDARRPAAVDDVVGGVRQHTPSSPSWPRGGPARVPCVTRRPRGRPASFLETGGSTPSRPTSRTSDGLRQLPGIAVQRLMADGYGFGAEGDWKTRCWSAR